MIYQVRLNLYFTSEDEANDFYHDGEIALPKATVINPLTPNQECSIIELIENHHDEDPHAPCYLIKSQDNCPVPP